MYQDVHLLVSFIPFFPTRARDGPARGGGGEGQVGGSRGKDIRNYIKTSEAKNSQVTAQKLRDLVAGDSSFHSLAVTPAAARRPSPSHPPRHCTSYLPSSLSFPPVPSSLSPSCYGRVACAPACLFISPAVVRPLPPPRAHPCLPSLPPASLGHAV